MPRSATHWRTTTDRHGRRVDYIVSDECTVADVCLVSIRDPQSDLPSRRMVRARAGGWIKREFDPEIDGPIPARGLIVWGGCKFDRPSLAEAWQIDRVSAAAIEAAINA